MPARHYHTAADVLAMPDDGNKYEVVRGELLMSPAPRLLHQRVVFRLGCLLGEYLDRYPVGEAFPGGSISWYPDSLVIPDRFVADLDEARTLSWENVTTLTLVIEVLSLSTADRDRFTKRRLYQEVGVSLYWLVDAEARVVEIWTPDAHSPLSRKWQSVGIRQGRRNRW